MSSLMKHSQRKEKERELSEGEKWLEANNEIVKKTSQLVSLISRAVAAGINKGRDNGSYILTKDDLIEMEPEESVMFSWVMRMVATTYPEYTWAMEYQPMLGHYEISWKLSD